MQEPAVRVRVVMGICGSGYFLPTRSGHREGHMGWLIAMVCMFPDAILAHSNGPWNGQRPSILRSGRMGVLTTSREMAALL